VGGQGDGLPPAYASATYYAKLSPSGGVISWNSTTSYPMGVNDPSCVASGGYVYCVGGYSGPTLSFTTTNAVYYAAMSPSGGLVGWKSTTGYPTVTDGSCATSGEYIVCVGGGTSEVYSASLSPSGGLSSWHETSNYASNPEIPSCVVSAAYDYCIGGIPQSPSRYGADAVYYSSITSQSTQPLILGVSPTVLGVALIIVTMLGATLAFTLDRRRRPPPPTPEPSNPSPDSNP